MEGIEQVGSSHTDCLSECNQQCSAIDITCCRRPDTQSSVGWGSLQAVAEVDTTAAMLVPDEQGCCMVSTVLTMPFSTRIIRALLADMSNEHWEHWLDSKM